MTNKIDEPAYSIQVIDMLKVANEYCLFVERIEKFPSDEMYPFIQKLIPLLYLKGSLLPDIFIEQPGVNERFLTAEQWESTFGLLRSVYFPIASCIIISIIIKFWIYN